ncbi:MAG: protein-glutamine gamma-glutamyltransferase [Frankiales bacterium]|nr:protein-glutamine gamma-glutamyltransferase [Frankiales bacterium]
MDRVKLTTAAGLLLGIVGISLGPAGGPSAGLLDLALLGLALWLGRGPSPDHGSAAGKQAALSGNQALLLILAVGGAAVLVASGAASRPLHGLAVAPFAMAAFALSSHNSRDLRSGLFAAAASLLVLSVADDRAEVMGLCALGLLPLAFGWVALRQLMAVDLQPDLVPVPSRPDRRPWSAAVVARLVVLTAAAALVVPSEPAPHLHPGAGDGSVSMAGVRGFAIAMGGGQLDLRQRGSLDSKPVLEVPLDSPTLWQAGYADRYDGSTWTRTTLRDIGLDQVTTLPLATALPTGAGLTASLVRPTAVFGTFLVYSPGPVIAVDGAGGHVRSLRDGSVQVLDPAHPSMSYTVAWATPGSSSTGTLSGDGVADSDPRWLTLPAELPARVSALARTVTASATTTQEKVSAVEDYLRTHEKYQLDSPVPAEGTDAVDAFLFTDHVGFCEQFASAEAVMLRAVGVPARVATGFGGQGAPGGDPSRRVYRNEDAHAWVQVGYGGGHWVSSDPTAGSQLVPPSRTHAALTWLRKLWKQLTGTPQARRLLALGLLVLAALTWQLVRLARRMRRSRKRAPAASDPRLVTDAGRAYQRLLRRLAEQQRPRRPNETVRDLLLRLRAPDVDSVARVLEAEWYGGARVSPALSAVAAAALDQLAPEALVGAAP